MRTFPPSRAAAVAASVLACLLTAVPAAAATHPPPAGAVAAPGASADPAQPTAPGRVIAPGEVIPGRLFVNSVGVGVHLSQVDSAYANYPAVKAALLSLGVRHVRDSVNWHTSKFLDLSRSGIKVLATIPRGASSTASLDRVFATLKLYASALSGIGGPNEFESTVRNWVPRLRAFQRRIYTRVQADPQLRPLPVLAPSLRTATRERLLGDLSRHLDRGAVHAYPFGSQPEERVAGYLREASVTSRSEPVVVTETGMASAPEDVRRRHGLAYSQRAAGIYTPRLVLEYFRMGVARTYLYELLNRDTTAGLTGRDRNFGLLNSDFTPKIAFVAIRTLLRSLDDTGSAFPVRPLAYSVTASRAVRRLTFQKSNGTYYVALWNPVSVWSGRGTGRHLYPTPVPATVTLPFAARRIDVIDLRRGATPVRTVRGVARMSVDVLPAVQLLRITR